MRQKLDPEVFVQNAPFQAASRIPQATVRSVISETDKWAKPYHQPCGGSASCNCQNSMGRGMNDLEKETVENCNDGCAPWPPGCKSKLPEAGHGADCRNPSGSHAFLVTHYYYKPPRQRQGELCTREGCIGNLPDVATCPIGFVYTQNTLHHNIE